jgi:hypothetical protein
MATINNRFENLTLERLQEIYDLIVSSPTSVAWGSITGTLALQTDLQTALNAKFNNPTGTISQYIRGDGSLATFPTIPTVTPSALTKTDDTNVTLTLGGTPGSSLLQAVSLTLGWTGTLADSRIASASTWNAKQNAITLTTTGTSGAATLVGATLNVPQYTASSSTVYVFNMNSFAVPNVSLFYGVYLGGTPVSPATVSTQYGSAANAFLPGYPMPAGTASTLVVILRAAQVAPTSTVYVKIANTDTSTFGPVVTIAAGSAAGTYTDNSATVSFTTNQRLTVVASNPFVAGATSSGTLSTGSFKYAI